MKKVSLAALALALHWAAPAASAGEFSVACSYTSSNLKSCASVLRDIVSDKFIAKFPAHRFQIFVHSNIMSFTDGGYAAYAVAGVVPQGSGQFPLNRFSSSKINGGNKKFDKVALAGFEYETYRSAVRSLMEECEISPSCDVYQPRGD